MGVKKEAAKRYLENEAAKDREAEAYINGIVWILPIVVVLSGVMFALHMWGWA